MFEVPRQYAKILKENAASGSLLRVLLFGSTAHCGLGRDMDIIIEVPEPIFLQFASECVGAFDGYHPFRKEMLPYSSLYWTYESPQLDRLENALKVIGITPEVSEILDQCIMNEMVDMLCLPVGWERPDYADGLLEKAFGIRRDPKMLDNIRGSVVEV